MPIFQTHKNQLTSIDELKFDLEKDIQTLTEQNLETVFGLQFVATEFTLNGLRIDTLAFDKEAKAFVIIEYKRDRSLSVIDQGYAYLSLMLNNKADFILEYNEHGKAHLGRSDIDWSQSRVIFVANSFTTYQQQAINFKDLPIELWEAKRYSNGTVLYNQLKSPDASESIKTVSKNQTIQKVSTEVKKYTLEDHFSGSKARVKPLYESLRDKLFNLDSKFIENPRRHYIGITMEENGTNTLLYIHTLASGLRVDIPRIEPTDVNDPLKKLIYKPGSKESYNTPISQIYVKDEADIDYALPIAKQVYERVFGLGEK